jgi:hypothetical protein
MKKIAQGRERRRDRQLEAAERQAESTGKLLTNAQKRLATLKAEKGLPNEQAVRQQGIDRWTARVERLTSKLAEDQNRLQQLKSGNYPT